MIPGEVLKYATPENAKKLKDFLIEQFGLDAQSDFEGLIPLALLLYPRAIELAQFMHNLLVIEGQVMTWLENAGADIQSAIKTIQNPVVLGPILPGGIA